ncbi:MAG: hypothetical protein ACT4OK_02070 [Gemmobacter sp.]
MKPPPSPSPVFRNLLSGGLLRSAWVWLLSVVLALGLVLGQAAEAGAAEDHHLGTKIEIAGVFGQQTASAPACDPGLTCAAIVLPEGPFAGISFLIVIVLRPDMTQSQRRFGGPSVTLPPPRPLT